MKEKVPEWSPTKYENVHKWIEVLNGEALLFMDSLMAECESPIEELFAVGLCHVLGLASSKAMDNYKDGPYKIMPQHEIDANGSSYRVDFYIEKWYELKPRFFTVKSIIVECDGYEYHSTKEQIAYDNKRDTDILLSCGTPTIRFTGGQLDKDPLGCAETAIAILDKAETVEMNHLRLGKKLALENLQNKRAVNKDVSTNE